MAFTKVTATTDLGTALITSEDVDSSPNNNVTGASGGRIYQVRIDNTENGSQAVYFKIADASSATPGVTNADLIFYVPKGEKVTYVINTGHPYTSGVSMWCTTFPSTTSTSSPGNSVPVSLLAT
jgi:hypothetical protein